MPAGLKDSDRAILEGVRSHGRIDEIRKFHWHRLVMLDTLLRMHIYKDRVCQSIKHPGLPM